MKYSMFTLILAAATLAGSAAFAAGGLHKHDASIASYSYSIPIIDSSSSMNRPGTSLRDDIEKGYKPSANQAPFTQTEPRQVPQQAPQRQQIAPQASAPQQQAPANSGSTFSNVTQGVTNSAAAPVAQQPAVAPATTTTPAATTAKEPVTLSTPDAPAAPQATTTPSAVAPTLDATKPAAPESALPQAGITITGENAGGIPAQKPAAQ
jgi:hypothetical protein